MLTVLFKQCQQRFFCWLVLCFVSRSANEWRKFIYFGVKKLKLVPFFAPQNLFEINGLLIRMVRHFEKGIEESWEKSQKTKKDVEKVWTKRLVFFSGTVKVEDSYWALEKSANRTHSGFFWMWPNNFEALLTQNLLMYMHVFKGFSGNIQVPLQNSGYFFFCRCFSLVCSFLNRFSKIFSQPFTSF